MRNLLHCRFECQSFIVLCKENLSTLAGKSAEVSSESDQWKGKDKSDEYFRDSGIYLHSVVNRRDRKSPNHGRTRLVCGLSSGNHRPQCSSGCRPARGRLTFLPQHCCSLIHGNPGDKY